MSANNCTLIVSNKGKFYVFGNVNAESWDDINILSIKEASGVFDTFEEAHKLAGELDDEDLTEYGVCLNLLCKDGAEVVITD